MNLGNLLDGRGAFIVYCKKRKGKGKGNALGRIFVFDI